ncbi:unnamed protein product [Durusdinium trenchii]|uniref:Uncharacterized protein n=1 Tax=Durusdinium trenchii TaxID=1381693 RepID=A0ABP0REK5_9DINO
MRLPGFETILRTHLRVGVRHWASAAQTEGLQCGAQTNAGKLAGAIVARIREKSRVSIDTVGPQAGYTALKSIMIAEEYAKQDFKDKVLVVRPEMVKLEPREAPSGRMTETNAPSWQHFGLRMHVAAADQFKEVQQELVYFRRAVIRQVDLEVQPFWKSKCMKFRFRSRCSALQTSMWSELQCGDTNPGTAAGLLSRLVESKGMLCSDRHGCCSYIQGLQGFPHHRGLPAKEQEPGR